jgi:hypothetical protein
MAATRERFWSRSCSRQDVAAQGLNWEGGHAVGKDVEPNLGEILDRNLNDQVPVAIRSGFNPDERALVAFPHRTGGIFATNQRVIVERLQRPPFVFAYGQLTGAIAHLGLFYRYLILTGPGLPDEVGVTKLLKSSNAAMVEVYQKGDARRAAAEMSLLIASANGRLS